MPRQPQTQLDFVETFVDALTVRPFLNDLRRARRLAQTLRRLDEDQPVAPDTANAA